MLYAAAFFAMRFYRTTIQPLISVLTIKYIYTLNQSRINLNKNRNTCRFFLCRLLTKFNFVFMGRGEQQIIDLLPSFSLLTLKAKPSGLPDSNFILFVATKKTKQKKARRGAGICVCMVAVLLTRIATSAIDVSPGKETKGALPPGPPR